MEKRLIQFAKSVGGACQIGAAALTLGTGKLHGSLFCMQCDRKCDYINTHTYGLYESTRWGGKYIYYCARALVFAAAPAYDENGSLMGGVIAGPVLMGERDNYDADEIRALGDAVPDMGTRRVDAIADLMAAGTERFKPGADMTATTAAEQARLLNDLYEVSSRLRDDKSYSYPIDAEKELQAAITGGDKPKAREALNLLLGYIYFASGGDLGIIKSRVTELIVLLSRAAIDGGADVREVFWLNTGYLNQVSRFGTLDDLSAWLGGVMNRFVSFVFDLESVKHTDVIQKVVRYIRAHHENRITLEEIAAQVYLSKSYLSKIFKDEMGCTITDFINRVRVEKSKSLLLASPLSIVEVANAVGFEDQSYFTKIFSRQVGISPGKFRERGGKNVKKNKKE